MLLTKEISIQYTIDNGDKDEYHSKVKKMLENS